MKKMMTLISLFLSLASYAGASDLSSYEGYYEDQLGKDSFASLCGQKIEVSGSYINVTDVAYQNLPGKQSGKDGECSSEGIVNTYKCTYKNCVNINAENLKCSELFLLPKGVFVNINKCTRTSRKMSKIEL